MHLYVDAHSPIPIRRQLAEQLTHFIESGGFPREQPLPTHPRDGRLPRHQSEYGRTGPLLPR